MLAAAVSANLPLLWSSGVRIDTSCAEFCFQSDKYAEMKEKTSSSFRRVNDEMERGRVQRREERVGRGNVMEKSSSRRSTDTSLLELLEPTAEPTTVSVAVSLSSAPSNHAVIRMRSDLITY